MPVKGQWQGATLGANTFTGTQTMPALAFTQTTWANIGSASTAGMLKDVSDAGPKGSTWRADGTHWKPVGGVLSLATLDTVSSNIPNSETIVFQYLLPAGLWQTGDRLQFKITMLKSGATDTGTIRIRVGTAGTTSDTQIFTSTLMAASSRVASPIFDLRLESATSVQQLATAGATNIALSYGNTSTSAYSSAVTVTSVAANASYVSVGILASSTNDTVALKDAQILLIASAN